MRVRDLPHGGVRHSAGGAPTEGVVAMPGLPDLRIFRAAHSVLRPYLAQADSSGEWRDVTVSRRQGRRPDVGFLDFDGALHACMAQSIARLSHSEAP
jgi:hypothetical protein